MLGIQYTGYNFDISILVVSLLESKISCSIRIVPEVTINSSIFSLQSQLDYNYLESYQQS